MINHSTAGKNRNHLLGHAVCDDDAALLLEDVVNGLHCEGDDHGVAIFDLRVQAVDQIKSHLRRVHEDLAAAGHARLADFGIRILERQING